MLKKETISKRRKRFFAVLLVLVMALVQPLSTSADADAASQTPTDDGGMSFAEKITHNLILAEEGSPTVDNGGGDSSSGGDYSYYDYTTYYSITYENVEGADNSKNTNSKTNNTSASYAEGTTVKLAEPIKTGYVFEGWYTTEDFSEDSRVESVRVDKSMTLYARFNSVYSITYVLDEYTTNDESNPETYDYEVGVEAFAAPVKEGYDFDGWYTDTDFTDEIVKIEPLGDVYGDQTLYARFVRYDKKAMYSGDELNLKTEYALDSESDAITFESDNEEIITVDENGLVTAKAAGTATVTVFVSERPSVRMTIAVAERISLKDARVHLSYIKCSYTGKAKTPEVTRVAVSGVEVPASEYTVKYYNNIKAGNAKVQITAVAGGAYKDSRTVTFAIEKAVQNIEVSSSTKSSKRIEKISATKLAKKKVKFRIYVKGDRTKVTYTSSKKKYVTVSSRGAVTVKENTPEGEYKITVKAQETGNYKGDTAVFYIRVK